MWLYKLTHKRNGKAYIGTSVNAISKRISRHLYSAKRGDKNMAICHAINKYGIEAFTVKAIGESDNYEELLRMEAEAIKSHGTLAPLGYNITDGGRGARRPCSLYTRALISAKTMGRKPWNFGKKCGPLSDETRQKLSVVRSGRKAWNKGISATEETKLRMSESHKGEKNSHATRVEFNGVIYPTFGDAVKGTGLTPMKLQYRLDKGIGRRLPKEI